MDNALLKVSIVKGDITEQNVDAIVNAANSSLLGGGGVDGAIHRAAGPELLAECAALGGCPPGEAKTTKGYRLPAKFVIHTVGPIWRNGRSGEEKTLGNAYTNSLREAVRIAAQSVAFPAISTGVYRFPPDLAAEIAVKTVLSFLKESDEIKEVRFVCFSDESVLHHERALEKYRGDFS
jgi:O-acetyl-ADP-ribose deacetylase (regulator of RNase III)